MPKHASHTKAALTDESPTQQLLEQSERRLRYVLDATGEGIWDWQIASNVVTHNLRWCQVLGLQDSYLQHSLQVFSDLLHEADKPAVFQRLQLCLSGKGRYYSEHRMQLKDGRVVWVQDRGDVVERDANGAPVRMVGSLVDISERKLAELALNARTELLKAIFELSPDGFVAFDDAGLISYVSPAFCQMTSLQTGHLLALDESAFSALLAGLCPPGVFFSGLARLHEQAACGRPEERAQIELAERPGLGRRVLEVGLRLSQSSTVSQILYFRDVTRESEIDQMKSEFLSTAAHELRTPMASIYGFAELLQLGGIDQDSTTEFLGIIYRQSGLMISILNELLDLARIEARRGKDFVIEPLSLQTLISAVVRDFKLPPERAPPAMKLPAEPFMILADQKKVRQAVLNVLSNAYKYSPAISPVTLSLERRPAAPGQAAALVLNVCDAGIGMSADQVQRVCERFYRVDATGRVPGTGLGMSVVKEIMEIHHGRVEIASQPGKGTVVSLVFACDAVPAAGIRPE